MNIKFELIHLIPLILGLSGLYFFYKYWSACLNDAWKKIKIKRDERND